MPLPPPPAGQGRAVAGVSCPRCLAGSRPSHDRFALHHTDHCRQGRGQVNHLLTVHAQACGSHAGASLSRRTSGGGRPPRPRPGPRPWTFPTGNGHDPSVADARACARRFSWPRVRMSGSTPGGAADEGGQQCLDVGRGECDGGVGKVSTTSAPWRSSCALVKATTVWTLTIVVWNSAPTSISSRAKYPLTPRGPHLGGAG
jgi:hypothetical protein